MTWPTYAGKPCPFFVSKDNPFAPPALALSQPEIRAVIGWALSDAERAGDAERRALALRQMARDADAGDAAPLLTAAAELDELARRAHRASGAWCRTLGVHAYAVTHARREVLDALADVARGIDG